MAVILIQTSASKKVKFKHEKASMIVALKKKNLQLFRFKLCEIAT